MPAHKLLITLIASAAPLLVVAQTTCKVDVTFTFTESAPRDRFEIRNDSSAGQPIQRARLELNGSAGRLFFDTAQGGAGVDVFQPFQVDSGEARLATVPVVKDGSDRIDLAFERFEPSQRFQFSIDVDDRLGDSDMGPTRVSGRELEGALLTVVVGPAGVSGREIQARVDGANQARAQASCS
jgi:hypothetical protein